MLNGSSGSVSHPRDCPLKKMGNAGSRISSLPETMGWQERNKNTDTGQSIRALRRASLSRVETVDSGAFNELGKVTSLVSDLSMSRAGPVHHTTGSFVHLTLLLTFWRKDRITRTGDSNRGTRLIRNCGKAVPLGTLASPQVLQQPGCLPFVEMMRLCFQMLLTDWTPE